MSKEKRVTLRLQVTVPETWTRKATADMVMRVLSVYGPGAPQCLAPYARVLQEDPIGEERVEVRSV